MIEALLLEVLMAHQPDTRCTKIHNPGCIEANPSNEWLGKEDVCDDPRFECFSSPVEGLRALTILLLNYQEKYGLRTIEEIVDRYAPPGENPTSNYATFVAKQMGISSTEEIDLRDYHTMLSILKAIVKFENAGFEYDKGTYECAAIAGGVRPKRR